MSHSDTVHSSYASRDPATQAPAHGRRGCLLAVAAATLLAACAAPEKPVTTPVTLTLVAAPDTNPDAQGRASPLVTRYYVLKAPGAFELADFFALQDKDTATLGADLVQREEVVLRPGEQRAVRMTLAADTKALGFTGAYRDLSHARWRQSATLTPGQPLNLTVTFGAQGIALTPR